MMPRRRTFKVLVPQVEFNHSLVPVSGCLLTAIWRPIPGETTLYDRGTMTCSMSRYVKGLESLFLTEPSTPKRYRPQLPMVGSNNHFLRALNSFKTLVFAFPTLFQRSFGIFTRYFKRSFVHRGLAVMRSSDKMICRYSPLYRRTGQKPGLIY